MQAIGSVPGPLVAIDPPAKLRLDGLTGLRFLAALYVVFFHFAGRATPFHATWPTWLQTALAGFVGKGYLGVPLFFILSGFVLTYTYHDVGCPERRVGMQNFLAARFARIYPVYILALLLALPDLFTIVNHLAANIAPMKALLVSVGGSLSVVFLLQAWVPQLSTFWNIPAWSLSAEAFFYVTFPFVVNGAFFRRLSVRGLVIWLFGLWGSSMLVPAKLLILRHGVIGTFDQAIADYNPLLCFPEFLMGMALGRLFLLDNARKSDRHPSGGAWLTNAGVFLTLLILFGVNFIPSILLSRVILPFFCLLVFGLARGEGRLHGFLSMRWFVVLGEASYAVYILQYPVILRLCDLFGRSADVRDLTIRKPPMSPLFLLVFVGVLVAVSIPVFQYIETPLRSKVRRLLSRPT